jgi:hypothetical protein
MAQPKIVFDMTLTAEEKLYVMDEEASTMLRLGQLVTGTAVTFSCDSRYVSWGRWGKAWQKTSAVWRSGR